MDRTALLKIRFVWFVILILLMGGWYLQAEQQPNAKLKEALSSYKGKYKILYETYLENNWEIFVMDADGSNQKNLTNRPDCNEMYPQTSPDGTKLCFVVDRGQGKSTIRSVYYMNIDGTGRTKIADYARQPTWSPDGRIIYCKQAAEKFNVNDYYTKGLFFYDLKTGKHTPHQNNDKLEHLYGLSCSPNGKWIAATIHGAMGYRHVIILIETDGDKIIEMTGNFAVGSHHGPTKEGKYKGGCRPCISPDGKKIIWGDTDHEFIMADIDFDSDNPRLANEREYVRDRRAKIYHVEWSPDSKFLTLSRGSKGGGQAGLPGTHRAAHEVVGVYAKGWDIVAVSAERQGPSLNLNTTEGQNQMVNLTNNGMSNKESEWIVVKKQLPEIVPQDGAVWIEDEGVRGCWINARDCDDQVLDYMVDAKCNVLILSYNTERFLDLDSANWKKDKLVVDYRKEYVDELVKITEHAADRGIRTIFMSTYSLNKMKPTLERLGYSKAYVEGPYRYVSAGQREDASPFDKILWEGLIGAYGEHIARLSLKHPIFGIMHDAEHYGGGTMYLQGCGYGNDSFVPYLESRGIAKTADNVPAGTRYEYLKNNGLLHDYWGYLEERIYLQGRTLAKRWHSINPNLVLGIWPLFDNWFSKGFLRGLGGEVSSLGLSHCSYVSGSFQERSMAEYFESKNSNLKYMPGFLNLRDYKAEDMEYHVKLSLEATGGRYWILSPQKRLRNPNYRDALSRAYNKATKIKTADDKPAIDLEYAILIKNHEPLLVVGTAQKKDSFENKPLLTLRSVRGGAVLCEKLPMELTEDGRYGVEIKLVRLLTNNLYQEDGFRSGLCYEYKPTPRRILYEDTEHTKLIDGRAYGFFGTTAAWKKDVTHAEVIFDLHRRYQITRVALSQPKKLEDGFGGPTRMALDLGLNGKQWLRSLPFIADLPLAEDYKLNEPKVPIDSGRHGRAWLNWFAEDLNEEARWLRIRLDREHKANAVISLGEVLIWGAFNGQVQASVIDGDDFRAIEQGKRFNVVLDM